MTIAEQDSGKKKNGGGRKNGLAGFKVDLIDGALMRAYVKREKLKIDLDVEDQQLAFALYHHFKTMKEDDLILCTNCHAVSPEAEDSCPFCGDEGEPDEKEVAAAKAAAESFADAEGEDDAEEDEEEDDDAEADDEDDDEDDEEEDEEDEAPPKKEGAKMSAESTTQVNGAAKKDALAKPADAKLTAGDLDKAVAKIKKLQGDGYANYWNLAHEILVVNKKFLWRLRKDEKGAPVYKSFDAWVHHELNMSPTHAYSAMEIAQKYSSPEEIRELGGKTKAALILKAAEKDQPKLREKAKAGATKRELEKDVAASRKKNGSPKRSQQAKAGAAGKAAQQKTKAKEKITVANIVGSRTIKLYKKPQSMKGIEWPGDLRRASAAKDLPFGRLELQPGVVQWFSVIQKDDGWVLNIQTVREEG
jgi:hypothetical protein